MQAEVAAALRARLEAHADPAKKAWWENYVQGSAPFLGVTMATVRAEVHRWVAEEVEGRFEPAAQVALALALFEGTYAEQKLAGTLFLQEILLPAGLLDWRRDLERFAALFAQGLIYDWNLCDWFCVKVLGPLIEVSGRPCAEAIAGWCGAENLWQARASLVPFVKVAGTPAYYPAIADACAVVIRRPERFAKTAVGWVLREVSKHDRAFVREVIGQHEAFFSAESLKNATKYLNQAGERPGRVPPAPG